jgi:hypothetical protein
MAGTTQFARTRVIVIPRPLEGHFYERLAERFAGREDVSVVVDRRVGERRHDRWVSGPGPFSERRRVASAPGSGRALRSRQIQPFSRLTMTAWARSTTLSLW